MTVLEMARIHYPEHWNDARLDALVAAGKLTKKEANTLKKEAAKHDGD